MRVIELDRPLGHQRDRARPSSADAASLYEAYGGRIRSYIAFRVRNEADADDLAAEVFRRVITGPMPEEAGTWPTWLFRVAQNLVVDHYRKRRFPNVAFFIDRPDDAPSLPEQVIRDEQLRTVDAALAGLPGKQRAAIYLRFYEDLAYADVASILGIPATTARSLVHRGLKRVALMLEPHEGRS